jgi:hypothetical protein
MTDIKTLIQKLESIQQSRPIEECGMMPPSISMSSPKQQDSVTMNVSMNGSGAGGIRDLLDVLRDLQSSDDSEQSDSDIELLFGKELDISREEYQNEPDEMYGNINTMTGQGDDLHSKSIEKPAVAGGGNPMSIKPRLESLYQEIKRRTK